MSPFGRVHRINSLIVVSLLLCCACSSVQYKIDKIDYSQEKETKAGIMLSDPQVFERASLINDRRREMEYLQQLLQNSGVKADGTSVIKFLPQITQDLHTIHALSASLGLNIGKSIPADPTAADLSQQLQIARLKAQLALVEKQIAGIQAAELPTIKFPEELTAGGTPAASVTMPDVTNLKTALTDLQGRLDALAKDIAAPGAPRTPDAFAGFTDPRNDFLDRQAYRRDLRAAMAEAQLDDAHARAGGALYRLQFQATVLPRSGDVKQWAAARMSIVPPELTRDDVTTLYFAWLDYVHRTLSTPLATPPSSDPAKPSHSIGQDQYYSSVQWFHMFELLDIFIKRGTSAEYACMDHRTATEEQLQSLARTVHSDGSDRDSFTAATYGPYVYVGTYAVPEKYGLPRCNSYPVQGMAIVPATLSEQAFARIRTFTPPPLLDGKKGNDSDDKKGNNSKFVPEPFCERLVDPSGKHVDASCKTLATWGDEVSHPARAGVRDSDQSSVRTYSIMPAELSQRLGLTSETSESFQKALSIAALVSSASTAKADIGSLSQADIRTQAIVRQPLVVGFANSESVKDDKGKTRAASVFGWLFGPEFIAESSRPWFLSWLYGPREPKSLLLGQRVHSYGVTADVSLPGWWSYADFCAETAWVANWRDRVTVLEKGATATCTDHPVKRVRFPLTDASLEAVTNFVAAGHLGSEASPATLSVSYVTPTVVPSCSSTVVFQVGGSDIWQADRAYLGGVRAETVEVLPDMKGIAAKFDMNGVFGALVNTDSSIQKVPLVVASKQGTSTTLPIYVVGKRQSANGATACQSPILLPTTTDILPPTVVDVTPREVCSGTKDLSLSVHGLNLPKDIEARGDGLTGPASSSERDDDVQRIVKLSSDKGLTPGSLAIALSGKHFAHGVTLTVNDCSPAKDKSGDAKKTTPASGGKKKDDPKAKLVTKSVKLAANQPVHVTVKIPDSYAEVVLGVRTKGGIWLDSSALTPTPGDSADVKAVFDLSKVNAKSGDSLEVRVKIRTRPGIEAQKFPTDVPLPIDAAS